MKTENYVVWVDEAEDGTLSVIVQPKDTSRNQQVILNVPVNEPSTSTVMTLDVQVAVDNIQKLIDEKIIDENFRDRMEKNLERKRAQAREERLRNIEDEKQQIEDKKIALDDEKVKLVQEKIDEVEDVIKKD